MFPRRFVFGFVFVLALLCAGSSPASAQDADLATQWNERALVLSKEGRYADALAAFGKALDADPGDDVIRRNLALTRGNYGVQLLKEGRAAEAEAQTRRALEVVPDDPILLLNLAACLDEQGYPAKASEVVMKAAEKGPKLAAVQRKLGSVHYREGRLADAVGAWERAVKLEPTDKGTRKRLERARSALEVEQSLSYEYSSHFTIYFDMERHAVLASLVLRELEEAQDVLRAEFQAVSRARLKVVLLGTETFRQVTGAHRWVAGLFDGQIRLPVKDAEKRQADILRKARHEYVHAVLASLGKRAPAWMHEGLAQVFEGRAVADARKRLNASTLRVPFEELAGSFANTKDAGAARLQYDSALAFTAWLRAGERNSAFRAAMQALFEGAALDASFKLAYEKDLPALYGEFLSTIPIATK